MQPQVHCHVPQAPLPQLRLHLLSEGTVLQTPRHRASTIPTHPTIRRRLCRLLYVQCTKKKINLPGVESEGRQIVCDKCYNEIVYATADAALGAAPPGMAMSPPLPGKPLPPLPTSSSSSPSLSPYSSPPMTPTYGGGSQPLPSPPPRPTAPKPAF